jgi:hypothetical protein
VHELALIDGIVCARGGVALEIVAGHEIRIKEVEVS